MGEETPLRQGEKGQEQEQTQEVKIYRRKAGMKKLVQLVSWVVALVLILAVIGMAIAVLGLLLASVWWLFLQGWNVIS